MLLLYPSKEEKKRRLEYYWMQLGIKPIERDVIFKNIEMWSFKQHTPTRKTRKDLKWQQLNKSFRYCHRHHINRFQVVCIPDIIHRAHPHNINKPETMVEINRIAMQYLFNCKA